jgi:hypothetical protein
MCVVAAPVVAQEVLAGDLRLNQVQVIGSHNSFKLAVQPELLALMRTARPNSDDVDYSHLSLEDQLNLGLRNLELDVYHDPEGGRYATPLGNSLLATAGVAAWARPGEEELRTPGFKLLHQADFDFRSSVYAFEVALRNLNAWSAAHPQHECVIVTMNLKCDRVAVPGSVVPGEFDSAALAALNALILSELNGRVLTPDVVRGDAASVREAVTSRGWPAVAACRGKYLFVLDEGGTTRERYLERFPNLEGAAYFVDVSETHPCAGVFVINDPIASGDRIKSLVAQGYIVRTRADADTREARTTDFSRFEAAKASGAQVITTDYYIPDRKLSDRYVVRFEGGGFVRVNPMAK